MTRTLAQHLQSLMQRLRKVSLSDRQALLLFVASLALLVGLMVMWLGTSTRAAVLASELDALYARRTELSDTINTTWLEIAQVTSPVVMRQRAQMAGFRPAERVEFIRRAQASAQETQRTP